MSRVVQQAVHAHGDFVVAHLQHHQQHAALSGARCCRCARASRGGQLQQRIQRHHGHELVAHNHSLALGHRQQGAARQTHQLGDVLGREAERLPLHLYQQHAQHGQRQRQPQAEGGAHTTARVDADAALQLIEHGLLDHIHAHAPPRQVGDHAAGGKAGQKNQINRLLVAQGGGFVGTEQAFFHGFVAHGLQRNARAIV